MVTPSTMSPNFTVPAALGEDRNRVRGPHSAIISPALNLGAVGLLELRAVDDGVPLALALAARLGEVDDATSPLPVHDHEIAVAALAPCSR
jgi:hypothetical protein